MVAEKYCAVEQNVPNVPGKQIRIRVLAYDLTKVLADLTRQLDLMSDVPKVITGDEPCEYFIILTFDI